MNNTVERRLIIRELLAGQKLLTIDQLDIVVMHEMQTMIDRALNMRAGHLLAVLTGLNSTIFMKDSIPKRTIDRVFRISHKPDEIWLDWEARRKERFKRKIKPCLSAPTA